GPAAAAASSIFLMRINSPRKRPHCATDCRAQRVERCHRHSSFRPNWRAKSRGGSRRRVRTALVQGPAGAGGVLGTDDAGGRGLVMGHYERGSKRVVPVEECPVHSPRGNRIAFALRDRLARAGISAAGPSLSGILRHLIIRTTLDEREAVAMLVVTRNDKSLRKPVRSLLDSEDRPDGFFINIHDRPGPFMVGPETIRIDGRNHVRETVGALSYLVSPDAFFQTNVQAAAVLQRCVIDGV